MFGGQGLGFCLGFLTVFVRGWYHEYGWDDTGSTSTYNTNPPVYVWPLGDTITGLELNTNISECGSNNLDYDIGPGTPLEYNAMKFVREDSSYVDIPIFHSTDLDGDITFTFHLYPEKDGTFFHYKSNNSFEVGISEMEIKVDSETFETTFALNNGSKSTRTTSLGLTNGTWYRIVVEKDVSEDHLEFYVETSTTGQSSTRTDFDLWLKDMKTIFPGKLRLGGSQDGGSFFTGRLACLQLVDTKNPQPANDYDGECAQNNLPTTSTIAATVSVPATCGTVKTSTTTSNTPTTATLTSTSTTTPTTSRTTATANATPPVSTTTMTTTTTPIKTTFTSMMTAPTFIAPATTSTLTTTPTTSMTTVTATATPPASTTTMTTKTTPTTTTLTSTMTAPTSTGPATTSTSTTTPTTAMTTATATATPPASTTTMTTTLTPTTTTLTATKTAPTSTAPATTSTSTTTPTTAMTTATAKATPPVSTTTMTTTTTPTTTTLTSTMTAPTSAAPATTSTPTTSMMTVTATATPPASTTTMATTATMTILQTSTTVPTTPTPTTLSQTVSPIWSTAVPAISTTAMGCNHFFATQNTTYQSSADILQTAMMDLRACVWLCVRDGDCGSFVYTSGGVCHSGVTSPGMASHAGKTMYTLQ